MAKIMGFGKEANRIGDARVLGQRAVGGRAKIDVDWKGRLLAMGRAEARELGLPWDFVMRAKRRLRLDGNLRQDGRSRLQFALREIRPQFHRASATDGAKARFPA